MHIFPRLFMSLAILTLPLAPIQAQAQSPAAAMLAAPKIAGFDVKPVAQPTPGNELFFTLYGSPGGIATVRIDGATGTVTLDENEVGVYEGSYTIRKRDRISAQSKATANLRLGNQVASAILDDPVVTAGKKPLAESAAAGTPHIDDFKVEAPSSLEAGEEIKLTMSGTPGGQASATIAGIQGKIRLEEVRSGEYAGDYTIRSRDRLDARARVTGKLRVGDREASSLLSNSLQGGAARSGSARAAAVCANCGVIEAVNLVEVKGEGSYLGMIAGGVAGALLGSQIGSGRGTTVAEVAGAVGGAYAGQEIEKRMKAKQHYEVHVRLDNGGTRIVSYAERPELAVGTRVRVEDGSVIVVQ